MTASEVLRELLAPALAGWRFQFGRWTDSGSAERYAVLRPMGGPAVGLVRKPAFSLVLIGNKSDAAGTPEEKAQELIALLMDETGSLAFIEPGEPVYWATDDGRPVAELAISTIMNR